MDVATQVIYQYISDLLAEGVDASIARKSGVGHHTRRDYSTAIKRVLVGLGRMDIELSSGSNQTKTTSSKCLSASQNGATRPDSMPNY